jgi:uncharacterized protein (TIGR02453 family)
MQFFTDDFRKFFSELEENNNRDWFNENKANFIKFAKDPFENFINVILNEMRNDDERIIVSPKEAIFRIYKDVRFSKDKLPYKTFVSAILSEGGRKDLTSPGCYIEMNKNGINFYGGAHFLERDQLQSLREFISDNLEQFQSLINNREFKQYFNEILGDKNKRIPSDFKEVFTNEPLIANKQFYFIKKLDAKSITSKSLTKDIMDLYHVGKPLINFIKIGIQNH